MKQENNQRITGYCVPLAQFALDTERIARIAEKKPTKQIGTHPITELEAAYTSFQHDATNATVKQPYTENMVTFLQALGLRIGQAGGKTYVYIENQDILEAYPTSALHDTNSFAQLYLKQRCVKQPETYTWQNLKEPPVKINRFNMTKRDIILASCLGCAAILYIIMT